MRLLSSAVVAALAMAQSSHALGMGGKPPALIYNGADSMAALQDIVTWDEHSLLIRGERVLILSGEFHPFRLPVPSLWIDVFQKVKALGLNCVSFYVDWALLEGKPGQYVAEGVFDFEPFFRAAKDAGIYLIARPGPYISLSPLVLEQRTLLTGEKDAEVSGGGFPGWLQRIKGYLRTNDTEYLAATDKYDTAELRLACMFAY